MEIGKTLYVSDREQWRAWLAEYHDKEQEIWLIYYKKGSGKPRIPYNDAVEEALCYGWIDSIVKGIDDKKYTQRFTPRKPKSNLSAMNRERVHRLLEQGKMTAVGLAAIEHVFDADEQPAEPEIAPDIEQALQARPGDVAELPGISRLLQANPHRVHRGREVTPGGFRAALTAFSEDDGAE